MKQPKKANQIPPLPVAYVQSLAPLLKEELQDFLKSYDQPWQRGLRQNPQKKPDTGLDAHVDGLMANVPWEKDGFYVTLDSKAGLHPLHDAGAYYLQEPSAMAAVAALAPQPYEWVLDLCAAPGGKSTQIAARMEGKGLLVSNEPVPSRAQVLSGNIERMGISNALVTSETPDRLAKKWPGCFDRILVDAPCSGEGMFRRHPEARSEWSPMAPAGCAKRQMDILRQAANMVKDGGTLCYSTCTFNTIENEGVVEAFLAEFSEFSLKPFDLSPDLQAASGMLHLFPHQVMGEGHFVALMQKSKGEGTAGALPTKPLPLPGKGDMEAYRDFCYEAFLEPGPEPTGFFAGRLVHFPAALDISGLKVLRAGLHLGEIRGKRFVPDHALAMAVLLPAGSKIISLNMAQAEAYLRGETLEAPEAIRGWALVSYSGLSLGWGKVADGRVQNHYPKGLRKG